MSVQGFQLKFFLHDAGGEGTEPDSQTEQEGLIVRINIFGFDVVCLTFQRNCSKSECLDGDVRSWEASHRLENVFSHLSSGAQMVF